MHYIIGAKLSSFVVTVVKQEYALGSHSHAVPRLPRSMFATRQLRIARCSTVYDCPCYEQTDADRLRNCLGLILWGSTFVAIRYLAPMLHPAFIPRLQR